MGAGQLVRDSRRPRRAARNLLCLIGLAISLLLALAACAETPEPTPPPPAGAPAAAATPAAMPTTAPPAGQTPLPTTSPLPLSSPVADAPSAPTPPPSPPSTTSAPWPSFLRQLDLGIPAGNSYGPRALAVHPDLERLYARTQSQASGAPGQITVLDRRNGEVLAIAETGLDDYADGGLAVDLHHNRVYAVNAGDSSASVLDASSLEPLTTLMGVDHLALDTDGGRLYVAGWGGLRILDAEDYTTLEESILSPTGRFVDLAVEPGRERLYLAYEDSAGYVLSQHDATTLEALAETSLPGRPEALVPDPNRDLAYLTLNDGQHNLFWAIDGQGRSRDERVLGEWIQKTHLAIDRAGDRLFLGREVHDNRGITVLDLESGQEVADIPLALTPNAIAWDETAGQLLASHTYEHKIGTVDVEAGKTSAIWPTALDLVGLAVDPERGQLYSTDSAGRLRVLDSETDELLATLPGAGQIAVDSAHGRLYTGGEGADRVRIFDAEPLQQTGEILTRAKPVADAYHGSLYLVQSGVYLASLDTMTVTAAISDTLPQAPGFSPNAAAIDAVVDAGSGRLYAIINNGVPGSNNGNALHVYEPGTYEKTLSDDERSPIYVDVDPNSGQAYVSRIHMSNHSTSLLEDGREYSARLEAVFGPLRVDSGLGTVYLTVQGTDEGSLLVLDAQNLDVLGSVPIPGGFTLRAYDPQRHLLYLATPDGKVQIWSATGGTLPEGATAVRARPPAVEIWRLFRGPADTPLFTASLYRSDDGSQSWQRITNGLPRRGVQQVVVSPDFARDSTLFAALMATGEGLGIWKSTDGGGSWYMASRGLSDLAVTDLAISPGYAADQTLFATTRRSGLFRSTDGGEHWASLTDRYYPDTLYPQPPGGIFVSPTYTQDGTLFVIHEGLYRSGDGGETWTRSLDSIATLALSPNLSGDQTLFAWSPEGGVLRSTDAGQTWQPASTGLTATGYGSGRLMVAPDFPASQTLYFVWTPTIPEEGVQFFRSTDAAQSWEPLAGQPPQAATPVELSADGKAFIALDEDAQLVYWPVDSLDWQSSLLPLIDQVQIDRLLLSPEYSTDQTLYALSEGAGVLRSGDAGQTWTDTGFPLRVTTGVALEPLILSPDTLFMGTPLGLYRFQDGTWEPVGGGLPPGAGTSSPRLSPDGSLSILVSQAAGAPDEGSDGRGQAIYLSTDGGETWAQPVPPLPRQSATEDLRFSPAFGTDHIAFIAQPSARPLRSSHGGEWQEIGPPGSGSYLALHLSPTFDRDGLIFLRLEDRRLWRSADGGDSWTDASGPWGNEAPMAVIQGTGYILDALTFSPDYEQDGLILTRAGSSLYRSTDQGSTWTPVLDLEPSSVQAAFAPDYARSGEIYLLQDQTLYHSTDRGQRWQALPKAPWDPFDEARLLLSPTMAQDNTLLVWTRSGRLYQSTDGGQAWRDVSVGLPPVGIRQVLFSPAHAQDRTLYLVPSGPGLAKRVGDSPWQASSEGAPLPTTAPLSTSSVLSQPTLAPSFAACPFEPDLFVTVWQLARDRLGCPSQPAASVILAEQPFERGRMIWDSGNGQIYVLLTAGTWQPFPDSFEEGVDPAYDPALPPPPQQPQRGFGKVWRKELGGPQAAIGWALEEERPVNGWQQEFDRGLLVWTDAMAPGAQGQVGAEDSGTAYLLYEDGTWEEAPAQAP